MLINFLIFIGCSYLLFIWIWLIVRIVCNAYFFEKVKYLIILHKKLNNRGNNE